MSRKSQKKLNAKNDDENVRTESPATLYTDGRTIHDVDNSNVASITSSDEKEDAAVNLDKKINKKTAKKTTAKKTAKKASTKASKRTTKKVSGKAEKATKKEKKELKAIKEVKSPRKVFSKKIEEELLKVTNVKSVEQIKKPKRVALMIGFYAVIVVAILLFCLIKFSKTKDNTLLLKETINYDYKTEEIKITTERIVEESSEELVDETSDLSLALATKSETKRPITTKAWPVRTSIDDILPRYKEIIYSYPIFNQMTLDELGILNSRLGAEYSQVKNKVFGPEISFDDKGTNGIIYLNYTYLQEFIEAYTSNSKQNYDKLPVAPYYNYIMNDKFNYSFRTYTTNLSMRLDFKNAKNQGMYFEIPATIFEPDGAKVSENGIYKTSVYVLKKAKVGFTESFSLTGLLEVLDIECHTKHNPFFDVEELVGPSPKVLNDMKNDGYDISSMVYDDSFNYVIFDKKGYISALYRLKS